MKFTKKILSLVLAFMMAFGACALAYADSASVAEAEENGTAETANVFAIGDTVTGKLSASGDADWYSFEVKEAGIIRITFNYKSVGVTQSYYNVALYSSADTAKAVYTFPVYGNADSTVSPDLALAAGTYYVAVTEGSSCADYEYNFTVSTVSVSYTAETEPNDSVADADIITIDTTGVVTAGMVYGTILGDDADYYTFTSIKGYISFNLRNSSKLDGGVNGNYKITLFQYNNNMETDIAVISLTEDSTGNVQTAYIGIDAGTKYYVKVEGVDGSAGSYGIGIYGKEDSSSESEYNNTKADADVLAADGSITGSLTSESDVDCYKITTTDTSSAVVKVSKYSSSDSSGWWKVVIKDENDNEIYSANVSKDNEASYDLSLSGAGTYYISVSSGVYTDADYVVSATGKTVTKTEEEKSLWDQIKSLGWKDWYNSNFSFLSEIDIFSTLVTLIKLSVGTLLKYFTT